MPKPPRDTIAIGYIHPGTVSSFFMESMLGSLMVDVAAEFARERKRRIRNVYQEWSSANVSASRNIIVRRFLEREEADWLLIVDADMQWAPEAVEMLFARAHWRDRPIMGGLCFGMQAGEPRPTIYQWAKVPGKEHPTTIRLPDYARDAVVKCAATGAAFLLVHRDVFVKMADAHMSEGDAFPWFQETAWQGDPVGEDITFCLRAAQLNIPTHVATDVKIGHHKSQVLTEQTLDDVLALARLRADGGAA